MINPILLGLPKDELERITMGSILSLLKEHELSLVCKEDGNRERS